MTPSKLFSRLPNIDLRLYARTRFTSAVTSVKCGDVLSFACVATGTRWVVHIHAKKSAAPYCLAMVEFGEAEEWTKNLTFRCSCKQTTVRYACVQLQLPFTSDPFHTLCSSSPFSSHAHAQYANYSYRPRICSHVVAVLVTVVFFKDLPDKMPTF
jgi:hypothetical protein